MTLQQMVGIARRRILLLVVGSMLPALVTYLALSVQPPVYQVTTRLLPEQLRLAGDPDYTTASSSRLLGLVIYYSYAAKSHDLLATVAGRLGLPDEIQDLANRVDADVDFDAAVLNITARAGDATQAARLANAVATAIVDESAGAPNDETLVANVETARQRMLEAEAEFQRLLAQPPPRTANDRELLATALTSLRELTSVYDRLVASVNRTPRGLQIVEAADPQLAQLIQPRPLYYALLAAVGGLVIMSAIVATLEYFRDTVVAADDIETAAGVRALGSIGDSTKRQRHREIDALADGPYPDPTLADAYRTLRARIGFASNASAPRSLLITSASTDEAKTRVSANLAVAFAQAGYRVLLVDADLRQPRQHVVFDLPNNYGLTTLAASEAVSLDAVARETAQPGLRVMTTGPLPATPAELLGSPRMRSIATRLKAENDIVIFDGSALDVGPDATIASSLTDASVVVVAAGRTSGSALQHGVDALVGAGATIIGAVLYRGPRRPHRSERSRGRLGRRVPSVASRTREGSHPSA